MAIRVSCECGKAFKVADESAGKRYKCPVCGRPITVPAAPDGPAAASAAPPAPAAPVRPAPPTPPGPTSTIPRMPTPPGAAPASSTGGPARPAAPARPGQPARPAAPPPIGRASGPDIPNVPPPISPPATSQVSGTVHRPATPQPPTRPTSPVIPAESTPAVALPENLHQPGLSPCHLVFDIRHLKADLELDLTPLLQSFADAFAETLSGTFDVQLSPPPGGASAVFVRLLAVDGGGEKKLGVFGGNATVEIDGHVAAGSGLAQPFKFKHRGKPAILAGKGPAVLKQVGKSLGANVAKVVLKPAEPVSE